MKLDTGLKGSYVSAARRRVGKGPGGKARRTMPTRKPKVKKEEWTFGNDKLLKEKAKNYKKHLGPRGRASKPGAKKLKGVYGEMDWNYKLSWPDMIRFNKKRETPKMKLKPKTRKPVPMKRMPGYSSDRKNNERYYIANHLV